MELFFTSSQALWKELFPRYGINAKRVISNIRRDTELSEFSSFNKRFKISWGMRIEFTDDLRITNDDTRACYRLMLKIADLWFAFEHLTGTASKLITADKRLSNNSKVDLYLDSTMTALGFDAITSNFNELLSNHVLRTPAYRQEIYMMLAYLQNGTKHGTRNLLIEVMDCIKSKTALQAKHIFALAYGLRNIYVHNGVAAALGHRNYKAKRALYSILHDSLILYSLALGDSYCQRYLQTV